MSRQPIIVNDLPNDTKEAKDYIRKITTSEFTDDMVTLLPSCSCGAVKGEFNTNTTCDICHTEVVSDIEAAVEPLIWFRKPETVAPLINPMVLMLLSKRFTKSGFNIIQWICDPLYKTSLKFPIVTEKLKEQGITRGYNSFVYNFSPIMKILFESKELGYKPSVEDQLEVLLRKEQHKIFSDYIPLPNKSLLVVEKTNTGIYVDNIITAGVDAINSLVSIDRDFYDQKPKAKENRTAKSLFKLMNFYKNFFSSMGIKKGHFRKHIFGTRSNYSFRAVISSITDAHRYDEIYLPWSVAVTVLRTHIISKLLRYGMTLNSIIGLIHTHVHKFHPLLNKVVNELIDETPDKGIYSLLVRYPSLLQGSVLRVKISKVKTDPTDTTIGLSIIAVRSLNADGQFISC